MDYKLNNLSIFRCTSNEEGDKEIKEVETITEFTEKHENLQKFLTSLIQQAFKKSPSLSPSASCKVYNFDREFPDDEMLIHHLLNTTSLTFYKANSNSIANKYIRSAKSRSGMLFVMSVYATLGKIKAPFVLIFKTDYISGLLGDNSIEINESIMTPELKKCMIYPHHDGIDFKYSQIRVFQKCSSDYFDKLFRLDLPANSDELKDKILREELNIKTEGNHEKYFEIPEEDRTKKRDCFGESRLVKDGDLLESDDIAHLSKLAQQKVVDINLEPEKLKLNIDNQIKFEARTDLLNQNYYFAKNGLDKYLIIKGNRFETKGNFKPVEFMKLESIQEVLNRINADSFNDVVVDDE